MDPETPRKSRLSLRKKKRILELLDAGVQNSYSDLRNLALSSFPLLKVKKYKIAEEYGTFPFLLIAVFSGVKAVYFHFSFQFLCKEMVLVRKSCPDQKLVYTFSDPKFPVKPQLSKGPTTFNSKDSSVKLSSKVQLTSSF